ncbi:hypothetical protein JCM15548_14652 [Geofilum rubicundum JCM 15548]|uniref:Uncharacterized protein n=1 Tax=Geofilum rubicundum JCM 15548 TaxID=1236989 RepID=A0A0E9LRB8_9BACT|nr:hypothetical protein JCM15548_14652 [Geofilum rubicundum JCM 15548]
MHFFKTGVAIKINYPFNFICSAGVSHYRLKIQANYRLKYFKYHIQFVQNKNADHI